MSSSRKRKSRTPVLRRPDQLTPRELEFVRLYLKLSNAAQAYIACGYKAQKTPAANANQANKLLRRPRVAAAVDQATRRAAKRVDATANRLFVELAALSFSNLTNYFDEEGNIIPLHELHPLAQAAVKKLKRRSVTRQLTNGEKITVTDTEFELYDKIRALQLLGTARGDFEAADGPVQVEIKVPGLDGPVRVSVAAKRAA